MKNFFFKVDRACKMIHNLKHQSTSPSPVRLKNTVPHFLRDIPCLMDMEFFTFRDPGILRNMKRFYIELKNNSSSHRMDPFALQARMCLRTHTHTHTSKGIWGIQSFPMEHQRCQGLPLSVIHSVVKCSD